MVPSFVGHPVLFGLILVLENVLKLGSLALYCGCLSVYELDGGRVKSNHASAPKVGGSYWSNTSPMDWMNSEKN